MSGHAASHSLRTAFSARSVGAARVRVRGASQSQLGTPRSKLRYSLLVTATVVLTARTSIGTATSIHGAVAGRIAAVAVERGGQTQALNRIEVVGADVRDLGTVPRECSG